MEPVSHSVSKLLLQGVYYCHLVAQNIPKTVPE